MATLRRVTRQKVGTVREGLRQPDSEGASVILLDRMIPTMSGKALLTTLKRSSRFADIPVVVFTAYHDRDDLPPGFLKKPVTSQDLVAAIQAHCP